MTVVRCEGLGLAYGRREALRGVSLEVAEGSVHALLGRNGAGKSSLVRVLLGHLKARSGRVEVLGRDPWLDRERIVARCGFVPETPRVPHHMSAAQASAFCRRFRTGWDQASVDRRLARFAVDPRLEVGALSRGQQTQVSLALALGARPDFLLLDDPTLGLDPVARRELFSEILEDLAERGTTLLIATHDLAGIEGIADRVGILHGGRLLLDEPMEVLKERHRIVRCAPDFPEEALGPLRPLRVTRGALGLEATVSAFRPEALAQAGLAPESAVPACLEDIFMATVAEGGQA